MEESRGRRVFAPSLGTASPRNFRKENQFLKDLLVFSIVSHGLWIPCVISCVNMVQLLARIVPTSTAHLR